MTRLRRAAELGLADWCVLLQSIGVVIIARASLTLLPLGSVTRLFSATRPRSGGPPPDEAATLRRIVWAVTAASRCVPAATCLTQALAAKYLLRRRGVDSTLRIGLTKSAKEGIEGHAWLESNGVVVLGNSGLERYTEIAAWGP